MKLKNILSVIVIVVCLSAMWSAYRKFDIKSRTYTVTHVSIEDSVNGECLTIKNEHPVKGGEGGFFQNTVANGSRVFRGQTVGCLYLGNFDPQLVNSLNLVNENLREAQLSQNSKETLINDTMTIDNTIHSYTSMISELAADRNQQEINRLRRDIDGLLERKQSIADGTSGKAISEIHELEAQKKALEAQLGNTKQNVISDSSGLFVMGCDGFETRVNMNNIRDISVSSLESMMGEAKNNSSDAENESVSYAPAKITDNNKWIIATVCESEKAQLVHEGNAINVRLKTEGEQTIECRVEYISPEENGKCTIFVSGTKEIENIYNSRIVDAEILIKDYEGLKVPKNAVLNDDNGKYVNAVVNGIQEKKYIEIIYEDADFVVVREDAPGGNALKLYDEVVSQ